MRKTEFAVDEHYHVYNRGINKQITFLDERDYIRFLFLIIHFQSPIKFFNLNRYVSSFVKHRVFNIDQQTISEITRGAGVKLLCFTLMPNHFHLILQEAAEAGIAIYMHRVLNAYAKYFNAKYQHSGHVFQGPYQAVPIEDNEQLLYTSAYIHRNCRELDSWRGHEQLYPWSSYQDYLSPNRRWGPLLQTNTILEQFERGETYHDYVTFNPAKEGMVFNNVMC